MSYDPGISGISGASDVFLSNPAAGNFLGYSTGSSKWQNATLTGYAALVNGGGQETVYAQSATTATTTLNLTNGNVFNVTLTVNTTFVFTGSTSGKACSFSLYRKQDATGSRTVAWPASVKWAGGTAPTLTTTANSIDILVFETLDGGTTWYGSLVGANFS
jgi:hypothetical protein